MSEQSVYPNVELEAIERQIEALIDDRISEGKPAFISAIGIALKGDLARLKVLSGLSLSDYLRQNLGDRYDLVQAKPNTYALWPKGQPFIPLTHSKVSSAVTRGPDYLTWFWSAFATPIDDGEERYYDPRTHSIVTESVNDDVIAISADLMRKADEPFNARLIHDRIEQWLASHKLNKKDFEDRSAPLARPNQTRTVLDAMVDCLDKRQLQGISISMDVVATLSRTFV